MVSVVSAAAIDGFTERRASQVGGTLMIKSNMGKASIIMMSL